MKYCSTRNSSKRINSAEAILNGISSEGGLFIPCSFPQLEVLSCIKLTYSELAAKILSLYLTDYEESFLNTAATKAYGEKFNQKAGAVKKVHDKLYSLELWHGPTCAFKDYALQIMPHLLVEAKKILNDTSVTKILVATSGDTGTAALNGYRDLDKIKIAVFYPVSGTSEVQRLQMTTQEGNNVSVYAVEGNFDNAQTGVKKAFVNKTLIDCLERKGEKLSSANSINWGRLAPQIVYYYYSYCRLVESGEINPGDKLDYCVPTGNFGDILAGYYAKQMGLPIGKLICASNKNNVLADFLQTGIYNAKREFYKTTSPSMDILISSNLERLLYHVTQNSETVADYMESLAQNGEFAVSTEVLACIQENFMCGWADDETSLLELNSIFKHNSYLCDPHTSVAFNVYNKSNLTSPCVIVSTASPYKFSNDVIKAVSGQEYEDEFDAMEALEDISGTNAPNSLSELKTKKVIFNQTIYPENIINVAESL